LIGNGFSIALFPNRFSYGSLLDSVDFTACPQARLAFDSLGTTDFEVVIQALRQAVTLLPIYGGGADVRALMEQQAGALKELLVQSTAGKHPERPSDVSEENIVRADAFWLISRATAGTSGTKGAKTSVEAYAEFSAAKRTPWQKD
jgi:hypothetical protein